VQEVVRDGPSDDAGIRAGDDEVEPNLVIGGDLITKVDGVDIQEPQDVAGAIADNKPGDKVTIEFYRGDERKSVEVELGERPDEVPGSGGGGGGGGDEDQPRPFPFP
jgi:S1-C subfamily serine protease